MGVLAVAGAADEDLEVIVRPCFAIPWADRGVRRIILDFRRHIERVVFLVCAEIQERVPFGGGFSADRVELDRRLGLPDFVIQIAVDDGDSPLARCDDKAVCICIRVIGGRDVRPKRVFQSRDVRLPKPVLCSESLRR